jgi:predicted ABC-type ATPase
MGSLLVVSGPPGAGKSTVAQLIADQFERSVLVEGDAFFGFLAAGAIEPWLPESHQQNEIVTEVGAQATGAFVNGGYDTVYDGVVGPWFLTAFARGTGLDQLDYAVILPSLDVCLERVRSRVGHGFSDPEATASMHRQFADGDLDQRHVITDEASSASEIAALISDRRVQGLLGVQIR